MSDTKYCKDCKNMKCPEGRVNCKYPDAIACAFYRDTSTTVFERITESPEVLAEEFCDTMFSCYDNAFLWYSMLTGEFYNSRKEAIAATVAKLKEVEK